MSRTKFEPIRQAVRLLPSAALAAAWTWSLAGMAAPSADPVIFIRQVGAEVPQVLANTNTIDQRRVRLKPFLARVVDVDAAVKFCLGRYWNRASPQQQQDIRRLFLDVLVNTVAAWTDGHKSFGLQAKVTIDPPEARADGIYIRTNVEAEDLPALHVTWVLESNVNPPRILDVQAEGLSVRQTERSDFVSYLNNHGGNLDLLIQVLRKRAIDTRGELAGEANP